MLKYVGNGAALPDVPARDLSDEDIASAAVFWFTTPPTAKELAAFQKGLIASGLYTSESPAQGGADEKPSKGKG